MNKPNPYDLKRGLFLHRQIKTEKSTIGRLIIQPEDREGFYCCDTLEDKYRDLTKEAKVFGETCIMPKRYLVQNIVMPRIGIVCPHLYDVEFFEGIFIHPANKPEQILGCIAPGYEPGNVKDFVENSQKAFRKLMSYIGNWEGLYFIDIKNQFLS